MNIDKGINKYTEIGHTDDENSYPILLDIDDNDCKCIVGIPVDDYEVIKKHMESIDNQLTSLECRVGIHEEWNLEMKQSGVHFAIKVDKVCSDDCPCTDQKESDESSVIEWLYKNRFRKRMREGDK